MLYCLICSRFFIPRLSCYALLYKILFSLKFNDDDGGGGGDDDDDDNDGDDDDDDNNKITIYSGNNLGYSLLGPTVFRGPRNFKPSRGIWVFAAEFEPRNLPRNSSFCRGKPRNLTFFIRTAIFSQKMTSK